MTRDIDAARVHLTGVFGLADFRPHQREIVEAALGGDDVLAVLPTGAGKSLCYQLPAVARDGMTVVASPLIALMRDQVETLRARGVAAGALNSANPGDENDAVQRAIEARRLKLVYVAPERLASPGTVELLKRGGANSLAVDEAHCISQWGHEFRPDYLTLRDVARELGEVQIIAVTATADERTRAEIVQRLFVRAPRLFLASFDRPNLRLAMRRKANAFRQIAEMIDGHRAQSGIVYCGSRERTETFALALAARGHRAIAYHAGLEPETRAARQDEFLRAPGVVMCATIAFGMGVDKPDVRFVCHADTPGGVEAWYQEIGRAGRDGQPADTLTLWDEADIARRRRRVLDGGLPRERAIVETRRLDAFASICRGARCRRQALLAAFGEASKPCGNCDVCDRALGLFGRDGPRTPAGVFLRASARRLASHAGAVLTGAATNALRQRARAGIAALGSSGLARGGNPAPAARADGDSLEGRPFEPTPPDDALSVGDLRLLAALRARRLELAKVDGRPPRTVATDEALSRMARLKPADVAACVSTGLDGDALARYGAAFLAIVRDHAATNAR